MAAIVVFRDYRQCHFRMSWIEKPEVDVVFEGMLVSALKVSCGCGSEGSMANI
jgi:hypothetical protein